MMVPFRRVFLTITAIAAILYAADAYGQFSITDIQDLGADGAVNHPPVGPPIADVTAVNFSGGRTFINGFTAGPIEAVNSVGATNLTSASVAGGGADAIGLLGPSGGSLFAVFALQGSVVSGPPNVSLFTNGVLQVREDVDSTFNPGLPDTWSGDLIATFQLKPQENLVSGRLFGLPASDVEDPPNALTPDLEITPANFVNIGQIVPPSTIDNVFLFEAVDLDADGDTVDLLSNSELEALGLSGEHVLMVNADAQFETGFDENETPALNAEFLALIGEDFASIGGGTDFDFDPDGIQDFFTDLQGAAIPGLQVIPEPASISMWALIAAVLGFAALRVRRKK